MVCSLESIKRFNEYIIKKVISGNHTSIRDIIMEFYETSSSKDMSEADMLFFISNIPSIIGVMAHSKNGKKVRDKFINYNDSSTNLQLVADFEDISKVKEYLNLEKGIIQDESGDWHSNNNNLVRLKKAQEKGTESNKIIIVNRKLRRTEGKNLPDDFRDPADSVYEEVALLKIGKTYVEVAVRRKEFGKTKLSPEDFINNKPYYTDEDLAKHKGPKRIAILEDYNLIKYHYNYLNISNVSDTLTKVRNLFSNLYTTVNSQVEDVKFEKFYVATDAGLEQAKKDFKSLPTLIAYKPGSDGEFTSSVNTMAIEPGSPFAVVKVKLKNKITNKTNEVYQVIKFVGKRVEEKDSQITELRGFLQDINVLEGMFSDLGFKDIKYGNAENYKTTINGEPIEYSWHSLFVGILTASENKSYSIDIYNNIIDKINKSKNKDRIYEQIAKVNNYAVTHTAKNSFIQDDYKVFDSQDAHVALPHTQVKKLTAKEASNLLEEKKANGVDIVKLFTDNGFTFAYTATSGGMLEARKTIEVAGKEPNSNSPTAFHILVSYTFDISSLATKNKSRKFKIPVDENGNPLMEPEVEFFRTTEDEIRAENAVMKRNRPAYAKSKGVISNKIPSNTITVVTPKDLNSSIANIEELAIQALLTGVIPKTSGPAQVGLNDLASPNRRVKVGKNYFNFFKVVNKINEEGEKHIKRKGISLKTMNPLIPLYAIGGNNEDVVGYINIKDALGAITSPENFKNGESVHNPTKEGSFGLRVNIPAYEINKIKKEHLNEDGTIKDSAPAELVKVFNNLRSGISNISPTSISIKEYKESKPSISNGETPSVKEVVEEDTVDEDLDIDSDETLDDIFGDDVKEFSKKVDIGILGYTKNTPEQVLRELQKFMPDMTLEDLKLHIGTLMVLGKEYNNYGAYVDGVISLLANSEGVSNVVLRHEAFHRIFDMYLPPKMRNALLKRAKRDLQAKGLNPSLVEIEEYLAERFQIFRVTNQENINIFKKFFIWLQSFLSKHLNFLLKNNESFYDIVFNDIENGKYSQNLRTPSKGGVKWMKNTSKHFMTTDPSEAGAREQAATKLIKDLALTEVNNEELFMNDVMYRLPLYGIGGALNKYLNTKSKEKNVSEKAKKVIKDYEDNLKTANSNDSLTIDFFTNATDRMILDARELGESDYAMAAFLKNKIKYQEIVFGSKSREGFNTLKQLIIDLFDAFGVNNKVYTYVTPEESAQKLDEEGAFAEEDHENTPQALNLNNEIIPAKQIDASESITRILRAQFKLLKNVEDGRFIFEKVTFRRISSDLLNSDPNKFADNVKELFNSSDKNSDAYFIYGMLLNAINAMSQEPPNIKGLPINALEIKNGKLYAFTKEVVINFRDLVKLNEETGEKFTVLDLYANKLMEESPLIAKAFSKKKDLKNHIIAIKKIQEASETITRIIHEIVSQSATTPLASTMKKYRVYRPDYDVENMRYAFRPKELSVFSYADKIKGNIVNYIQSILRSKEQSDMVSAINSVKNDLSNTDPEQIMHSLGLGQLIFDGLTANQRNEFKVHLIKTFEDFSRNLKIHLKSSEVRLNGLDISEINSRNFLFNQSSLNRAANALYTNSEQMTSLMYRDENNNLRFSQTVGSFVFDVLNGLQKNQSRSEIPEFLKEENFNTVNNYFLNENGGVIYKSLDFDYFKDVTPENMAFKGKSYDQMAMAHMFSHRFFVNFIGVLNNTLPRGELKKDLRYNQFLYIQSDRPSDTGAQINLASLHHKDNSNNSVETLAKIFNKAKRLEDAFYNDPNMAKLKGFNKSKRYFKQENFEEFKKAQEPKMREAFLAMLNELNQLDFLNPLTKDSAMIKDSRRAESQGLEREYGNNDYFQLFRAGGVYEYLKNNNYLEGTKNINKADLSNLVDEEFIKNGAAQKMYEVFQLFYLNNYLNGFHLNTLVFSSAYLTKDIDTLIKRMNGIKSPGKKQHINPTGKIQLHRTGNKEISNVAVLEDVERYYDEVTQGIKMMAGINGMSAEITDGVTIGTPSTLRGIHRGTADYNLKDIIKIVSFAPSKTGATTYLKTALFIVTDELARMFPRLSELRKDMESKGLKDKELARYNTLYKKMLDNSITNVELLEYNNLVDLNESQIDYAAFNSAMKVGQPKQIAKQGELINSESVVQVYNEFIRIQYNPFHEEGIVSNFSQLNFFVPTNQLNYVEALDLYNTDASLIENGLEYLEKIESLFTKDPDTGEIIPNVDSIKLKLERALENAKDTDAKPYELIKNGVDITFPSLRGKGIITLANLFSKATVDIKASGNKLIAQSAYGVEVFDMGNQTLSYDSLSENQRNKVKTFHKLPYLVKEVLILLKTQISQGDDVTNLLNNIDNLLDIYKVNNSEERQMVKDYLKDLDGNEDSSDILIPRKLQFRDKDGYTEVIAPQWWLDKRGFKDGKILINKKFEEISEELKELFSEGVSVRIPTTGIHSALAVKIIAGAGIDPLTKQQTNRIIVPEEVVAIHGSDFDIDSLFTIRREIYSGDLDSEYLNSIGIDAIKNYPVGYTSNLEWVDNFLEKTAQAKQNLDINDNEQRSIYRSLLNLEKQYLLNKKFNIYLSVITASKNRNSMNTPIDFNYIKRDFTSVLENVNFTSQEELDNTLEDAINSDLVFKEILKNEDGTLKNLGIKLEDVKKNKLKVTPEIEKLLLEHPSVGVKLKLKLVVGLTTLKQQRDPNNILDAALYHKDNFEGALGIGIQANFMKQLAYRMFSAPITLGDNIEVSLQDIESIKYLTEPQEAPIDSTQDTITFEAEVVYKDVDGKKQTYSGPVKQSSIELKKGISFLGTNLNKLRFTTINHKHKTFDLGDTIINGYIDNVKEQITWIMNSTSATIESIAAFLSLGVDLDTIAYIMNQPILKEGAKVNLGVGYRIDKLFSRLAGQSITDYEKSNANDKKNVTIEDVKDVLALTYGMNMDQLGKFIKKSKHRSKILKVQHYVGVVLFKNIKSFSDELSSSARTLSPLRKLPVLQDKLLTTQINLDLEKERSKSLFTNDNMSNVPSINKAMEALNNLNSILSALFPTLSVTHKNNIREIIKNGWVSAGGASRNPYLVSLSNINFLNAAIEDMILSLVITNLIENNKKVLSTENYIGIDTKNGKLITEKIPGKFEYVKHTRKPGSKAPVETYNPEVVTKNNMKILEGQDLLLQVLLNKLQDMQEYRVFEKATTIDGITYPKNHPVGMYLKEKNGKKDPKKIGTLLPSIGNNPSLEEAYQHNSFALELRNNKFMQLVDISLQSNGRGSSYVFTKGAKSSPEEDNVIMNAQRNLPNDIKLMLTVIDMIQNRSRFGFTGYTNYLDPQSYGTESPGLKEISKELKKVQIDFEQKLRNSRKVLANVMLASNKGNIGSIINTKTVYKDRQFIRDFGRQLFGEQIDIESNRIGIIEKPDGRPFQEIMHTGYASKMADEMGFNRKKKKFVMVLLETAEMQGKEYGLYAVIPESSSNKYLIPQNNEGEYLMNDQELIDFLKSKKYTRVLSAENLITLENTGVYENQFEIEEDYVEQNKKTAKEFGKRLIEVTNNTNSASQNMLATLEVEILKEKNKHYRKEIFRYSEEDNAARSQLQSEKPIGGKVVRRIASRLERLYGIKVVYDETLPKAGMYRDKKVYINPRLAGKDTPIHEFLHPIVMGLQKANNILFEELLAEIKQIYPDIESYVNNNYTTALNEEMLVIGLTRLVTEQKTTLLGKLLNKLLNFVKSLIGTNRDIQLSDKLVNFIEDFNSGKNTYSLNETRVIDTDLTITEKEELQIMLNEGVVSPKEYKELVEHLKTCR